MPWLIVSNAAIKSTRTSIVPCLLSMAVFLALVTYSSAVSVECLFATPNESSSAGLIGNVYNYPTRVYFLNDLGRLCKVTHWLIVGQDVSVE